MGKANVVTDALIRKIFDSLRALDARISVKKDGTLNAQLKLKPTFLDRVKELQKLDEKCLKIMEQVGRNEVKDFKIRVDGCLYYKGRLCMPDDDELKRDILRSRSDPSHVITPEEIEIQPDLTYEEEPVRILAKEIEELRSKRIPFVKMLWQNHKVEEATCEREKDMK
ncbi:uncharacterized protein LOC120197605 [Hibiscus syriacus]|uniref:uncharacterized protein LOC120197605 n=1 Tax=Hibiscus syriacus TaxID=106335 RepID=UPI001923286A|nr:uncharacterized protein LOC120197605 [Hibiscus syriacus]